MPKKTEDPAGKPAPYFSDLSSWEKASKENDRMMRRSRAKHNNPKGTLKKLNSQVTPGTWKTKEGC